MPDLDTITEGSRYRFHQVCDELAATRERIRQLAAEVDLLTASRDGREAELVITREEIGLLIGSVNHWADIAHRQERELAATREENQRLRAKLARAAYVAEYLMQMIDRETWRAHGADDGQGHYEGDYHEAQLALEVKEWAVLAASAPEEPPDHDVTLCSCEGRVTYPCNDHGPCRDPLEGESS